MMGNQRCANCLRWFLFVLNLLFWIIGLGLVGTGLWLRLDPAISQYVGMQKNLSDYYMAVYLLIALGCFITLLGFLGCCGALTKSQCMLVSFFIIFFVLIVVQIASMAIAYNRQDSIRKYIRDSLMDTVKIQYSRNQTYTKVLDDLQTRFECCGVDSFRDWRNSYFATSKSFDGTARGVIPYSCCNEFGIQHYSTRCGTSWTDRTPLETYRSFLHDTGCEEALFEGFKNYFPHIIGIAVAILSIELLVMTLTMLLCCLINFQKEERRKINTRYY